MPIRRSFLLAFALAALATQDTARAQAASTREAIDALLQGAVDAKKIPGGVLWLERDGKSYSHAYGSRALTPKRSPALLDTIFDAASLTKVMATAPCIMVLAERGLLRPSDKVSKHIPAFKGGGREKITIDHLLTHTSGLAPILPRKPAWKGYATAIKLACAVPLSDSPGKRFRYSDVNFVLLAEIVRLRSGKALDQFAAETIFRPLAMNDTSFNPAPAKRWRIAPTTLEGSSLVHGIVHDPAARAMGGVAGHAGLFTTTPDLARFARMLVNGGALGTVRILTPKSVKDMTRNQTSRFRHKVQRGYGWDIDSQFSAPRGNGFPKGESFGHTGWTGGSIWIHSKSKSFVIFLCNRNHPTERRTIKPLRERLGTLAGGTLGLTK
jgi:CubicO group peptidase (beta-lactamase class C family)